MLILDASVATDAMPSWSGSAIRLQDFAASS